jgi:hypothetical protein
LPCPPLCALKSPAFYIGALGSRKTHAARLARLKELGIELPTPGAPAAAYVPWRLSGKQVWIAGQIPQWNGERRFVGKVGGTYTVEEGYQAARLCALNLLAHLKVAAGGDLDRLDAGAGGFGGWFGHGDSGAGVDDGLAARGMLSDNVAHYGLCNTGSGCDAEWGGRAGLRPAGGGLGRRGAGGGVGLTCTRRLSL